MGITKFCVHPKNLRDEIVVVGGTKSVHSKKIQDLKPDIIICNKEENTVEMVAELSHIAPVWVSDVNTLNDNYEMISTLGKLLGVKEKAEHLVSETKKRAADFSVFMEEKPPLKVAYIIWKNPYMAVGSDTFINSLLKMNKYENGIGEEFSRYPEINIEVLKKFDLVLLSTEPFPFKKEDVKRLSEEIQTEVKLVDGEYFSWYGSRLLKAFDYFETLH